jgi:hypothetical protein
MQANQPTRKVMVPQPMLDPRRNNGRRRRRATEILRKSCSTNFSFPFNALQAAAIILARALVHLETSTPHLTLPEIPLHQARQIITRADFVQPFDHINIIHIDANGMVRADSVAMQNAFRDICSEEGFEEHLKATLNRLDELESLSRTREVAVREVPGRSGGEVPVVNYCARI